MSIQPTTAHLSRTSPRYADWLHVFGQDTVEIQAPIPTLAELPGLGTRQVYMLKLTALDDEQRRRLIDHIAGKFQLDRALVEREIDAHGVPILDEDIGIAFDMRLVI